MKISQIEPIRFTPFLNTDPRAVAGTTYIPADLMRRDDSTRLGPMAEYPIVLPDQTHGTKVGWVNDESLADVSPGMSLNETRRLFPGIDALLTRMRGVAIGVRTADCLPILMYARDIQAVGAVHAGWRGTLDGIARNAVAALEEAGARPENIFVRFAPAICGLCYEVDDDLAGMFANAGLEACISNAPKADPLTMEGMDQAKPHINLVKANRTLLSEMGIPAVNFYQSDLCTRHTSLTIAGVKGGSTHYPYYSWRRVPGTTRRNTSFVLLLPK